MDEAIRSELERIHDEDKRQNHRLEELESDVKEINAISKSVHELAINMQHMLEELERQSARIAIIESKPLESIKTARNALITTTVGVLVGAAVTGLLTIMK